MHEVMLIFIREGEESFHVLAMNNDAARIDFHRHRVSASDGELLCHEDQEMAVCHDICAD